jgi:diguanylate cyclase (GGDEF)-like protein
MVERRVQLASRMARVAGLHSFETPTLEAVERRRFQLWITALGLLLLVALALVARILFTDNFLPAWIDARVVQVALFGLVALFCAYAIEKELQLRRLTELLIAERVLTASLTQRLSEVNALLEASHALNLDLDLREVLTRIVHGARELLAARDASVMLVHGERELRTVAAAGESAARGARLRFGEGIAGRVAETREPVLISGHVERRQSNPPLHEAVPPAPESAMSLPLVHRGELLGVLNLAAPPGQRTFTEHDLRALSVFGEQAAAAIAHAKLLDDQHLAASQSRFQALHDLLTGLPNRALFLDRVEQALRRRAPDGAQAAVMFLDLDDFKRINDNLGHDAGDRFLTAFAERLRRSLRGADSVARFGGDEFALLVEGVAGEAAASEAAERVRANLEEPFQLGDRPVRLRASIGIAMAAAGSKSARELLHEADLALAVAKARGKGSHVLFDPTMRTTAVRRLDLEADLHRALPGGELEVHFQPIVSLASRAVLGVEAFLRWRHPLQGLLPAGIFVPLAEQAGLLPAFDTWALGEACRAATAFGDGADGGWPVYVNLSPSRLGDPALVEEIGHALASTGLAPQRLALEITESAVVEDLDTAAEHLQRLKTLGVRLALDDFGTGHSSLGYLRRFPVDAVKIDRLVVDGLTRKSGEVSLVRAIVRLAHSLDLTVIAEGIETAAQVDGLLELGCSAGQGWLFAPSMSDAELASYLAK